MKIIKKILGLFACCFGYHKFGDSRKCMKCKTVDYVDSSTVTFSYTMRFKSEP